MTFPSVTATNPTADSSTGGACSGGDSGGASHSTGYPATLATGDLIMIFGRTAGAGTVSVSGGGWTINQDSSDASDDVTFWGYKDALATGSEAGGTFTLAHGTLKCCAITMAISGTADPATQPPQASTIVVSAGSTMDPGTCTPTGGAKDYLWIWFGALDGEATLSKTPATNYSSNDLDVSTGTGGAVGTNCQIKIGTRTNNASSENPGVVTATPNSGSAAWTIAVHPAAAVVPPARPIMKVGGTAALSRSYRW